MGWMPCPIEISAINSMWSVEKRKTVNMSEDDAVFDFNTGYVGTAILALIFCALGALIQFGSGEEVQGASAAWPTSLNSLTCTLRFLVNGLAS